MSMRGAVTEAATELSVISIAVPDVLVVGTVISKKSPSVMAAASMSNRSAVVREAAEMSRTSAAAAVLVTSIPPVPAVSTSPVLVVLFPMVMVFAAAPVPRFTAPVVPESRVKAAVAPELTVNAPVESDHVEAAAPVRVRATSELTVVAFRVTTAFASPPVNTVSASASTPTEIILKNLVLIYVCFCLR